MTAVAYETNGGPANGAGADTPFRRYVCWDVARVQRVMDTEALQTAPDVFLATHSAIPLYRGSLSGAGGETALSGYEEEQFLADFLAPADFAFVAVLGGAGTGKSHLIRWLSMRIRPEPRRRVLLIPRAGTSLHEILRRILDGVEGERFDEYRARLAKSSTGMSLDRARVHLLDNLALAVSEGASQGAATEEEEFFSAELPHLLRDPYFRTHFLQPGGVLDRFATHVVGGGGVERQEERRAFAVDDLPLSMQDVLKASALAQGIFRFLKANEPARHRAVAYLNRHLDEAISQLMEMSGTDLLRLMIDVRAALATQGVELVILIEDLATLQGIDQQLLEALIIRPHQPDMPPLCALRTAVAMTTGYYDGLRKNVHQRFDFRVVMGEADTRGVVPAEAVEGFTARYLNAARLGGQTLEAWHRDTTESGHTSLPVPSACTPCQFRAACHEAFGQRDGMGLYPFTATAVATITQRVSGDGFNPRTQLKEGYKPILENYAGTLQAGAFPPPALLQRLGGVKRVTPLTEAKLRDSDPSQFERRVTLIDLWSVGGQATDLHPGIHTAFDLPLLGLDGVVDDDVIVDNDDDRNRPDPWLTKRLAALAAWRNGESMSEELASSLRELIYPAVVAHIDWNALHLIPGEFVGSGKPFRQSNSIRFARQVLKAGSAAIQLPIPLPDGDIIDASLALQGLLRFKSHGSWGFADGGRYYRAYLKEVAQWADHVVAQVNRLTESGAVWDPVPAAAELLSVGGGIL